MPLNFEGLAGKQTDLCCGVVSIIVSIIIIIFMVAFFGYYLYTYPLQTIIIVAVVILILLWMVKKRLDDEEATPAPSVESIQVESSQIAAPSPVSVLTQEEINSLYLEGVELLKQGQPSGAIKKFDIVLKIDPDHAPTWNARAVAMDKMGNLDQAFISVVNALRTCPTEQKYLDNYHKIEKKIQNRR